MKIAKGIPLDGKRRFNPGYYIALQKLAPTSAPTGYAEALQLLKDNPILDGLQLRLGWVVLEAALGVYDDPTICTGWAEFDGYLDDLGSLPANQGGPRKISVLFDVKRFDVLYDLVPSYLRDGINGFYGDGQFNYDAYPGFAGGRNLKFQNANVRARLNALMAEFGRRYANDPRIELIGFPEATPGTTPTAYYPAYNENAHLAGVLECLQSLAISMPWTIVRQLCNYTRAGMAIFVPNLVAAGIPAMGNPDAVMNEAGLGYNTTPGIYQHQQTYGPKGSNDVIIVSEVQKANYYHTTLQKILSPAPTWGGLTLTNNGGALQFTGAGAHGIPLTSIETVNTTDCGASIWVQLAVAGFPAGTYLKFLSVDSANAASFTNRDALTAAFTADIAGNEMTVSAVASGTIFVGATISGSGVSSRTITSVGTGAGGVGTYNLSGAAQTVTSRTMASSLAAGGLNYANAVAASLGDPWTQVLKANPTSAYPLLHGFTYTPNANTYASFVPEIREILGFLETDIKPSYVIFTYNTEINTRTGKSNIAAVVDHLKSFNTIHGNLSTQRAVNIL